MNFFILIPYIYALLSVSHGGILDWLINTLSDNEKFSFENLYNRTVSRSFYDYLDFNVEPCDNFYKFSCGKWIKAQQKIYGSSKNIYIGDNTINFNKFVKEFNEGKHNNKSKVINTFYNLRGKCKELPKDKVEDCQSKILNFGTYALSSIFIKRNTIRSEENGDYNIIQDMIVRIKEEFRLLIDEKKDIFDEETRNNFKFKLNAMKFVKNYDLHDLFNVNSMEDCYKKLKINYNDRIENVVETIKHFKALSDNDNDDLYSCRGRMFQPDKFLNDYVHSNAGYNSRRNIFSINSDYLNEPSFSRNFPMSINYGSIGYTIAHEILHAFDSDSYKLILEGDNENKFIVTQMSIENFKEKSDCFVKQYGMQKESITNRNINGLETLDENIADNGGLKIAHRAYLKYLQNIGGNDIGVPGFDVFTNEQLFFISAGKIYCEYRSKDKIEKQLDIDEHTPAEIRTNVALSNYKPFSDTFNCPVNSKMNSENKCELWNNHKKN